MSSSEVVAKEITWTCQDGVKLAGKRWKSKWKSSNNDELRILALHGWLDNSNSFDTLSHSLIEKIADIVAIDFVAIDLPGHGHSSHKSLDSPMSVLADYCYYVHETARHLEWKPEAMTIIGHSMGASIALMFAAAFPVGRLVMLDSLGPQTKEAESISQGIKKHVEKRSNGEMAHSVYQSFEEAVEARCISPAMYPGNQYISEVAARKLVERGSTIREDGKIQFRHDTRCYWPSILYLSEIQLKQLYKDVADQRTSTCVLTAKDGMPFSPDMVSRITNQLKPDSYLSLPGSHHFHCDPDSVDDVANAIISWLGF